MINIDNKSHYEKNEWQDYIAGKFDNDISEKVEAHLCNCDECLLVYSKLCEASEPDLSSISPDFTHKVMNSISTKRKNNKLKLSIYYATAASIAIFMTYTGFFNCFFKFSTQSEHVVNLVSLKTNTIISQNLTKLSNLNKTNKSNTIRSGSNEKK